MDLLLPLRVLDVFSRYVVGWMVGLRARRARPVIPRRHSSKQGIDPTS